MTLRLKACIIAATVATIVGSAEDYSVLGLNANADMDSVKAAYRREALKWHPDTNSDPNANDMFIRVSNAYENIKGKLTRSSTGEAREDAFNVFNDFMKGGSFSFSFSSGGGTVTGTSKSTSTVIKNGKKITKTEVKDLSSGRVEITTAEEDLQTGKMTTRIQTIENGITNSIELYFELLRS